MRWNPQLHFTQATSVKHTSTVIHKGGLYTGNCNAGHGTAHSCRQCYTRVGAGSTGHNFGGRCCRQACAATQEKTLQGVKPHTRVYQFQLNQAVQAKDRYDVCTIRHRAQTLHTHTHTHTHTHRSSKSRTPVQQIVVSGGPCCVSDHTCDTTPCSLPHPQHGERRQLEMLLGERRRSYVGCSIHV